MRPRPKIHPFPFASACALLLCLASLIFSLCYGNPNYGQSSDLTSTYWWAGAFGLIAVMECAIELFVPERSRYRSALAFMTSALEFFFVFFVIRSYFANYGDTEGLYRAPRYGAAIVLVALILFSMAVKVLSLLQPEFFRQPLHEEAAVLLLSSLGQLLFALFLWSDSVTHSALYGADGIAMIVAFLLALAGFLYALYLLSSKKALDEESVLKNAFYVMGAGILASLVTLFIAIGLWNSDGIAYQVFYWDVFTMIGYLLSCCGGGGYLFYVYYRLRN
jgi:hypothetical protein